MELFFTFYLEITLYFIFNKTILSGKINNPLKWYKLFHLKQLNSHHQLGLLLQALILSKKLNCIYFIKSIINNYIYHKIKKTLCFIIIRLRVQFNFLSFNTITLKSGYKIYDYLQALFTFKLLFPMCIILFFNFRHIIAFNQTT